MIRKSIIDIYTYSSHAVRGFSQKFKGYLHSGKWTVRIGKYVLLSNVCLTDGVTINDFCRLFGDERIQIGENVYINCFCMMYGDIIIEKNVLISQFVNIWGRSHRFSIKDEPIWLQHDIGGQGYKTGKIVIEEDSWIGPHVTILRGVTIGKGSVIGAGAVVTKDVPDYAVVFGIPAEIKYYRGEVIDE